MFETAEKKINKRYKTITYWENGVIIGRRCTTCEKDKKIDEFNFQDKKKGTHHSECKECEKRYREANKEHYKEYHKHWHEQNKERIKERAKKYRENNADKIKERDRKYRENNVDKIKEGQRRWYENNIDKMKEYRENNVGKIKERDRKYRENNKEKNLQYISSMLEQIDPVLKTLPIYGCIYKIENIKTGRVYIGQTIQPLKARYHGDVIKGWIEERKHYQNQKFLEELIEEDIVFTEALDVGCCKYHLDKLEARYIDQYDSCNNGYNNREGNHNTDDGLEEFNKILENNGLKFVDGKIITI